MFLQLWAVQACTVSSVEGQGLALRGPDGSMNRAIDNVIREYRLAFTQIFLGLIALHLSLAFFVWLRLPYDWLALLMTLFLALSLFCIVKYGLRVTLARFRLPVEKLVTGKFEGAEATRAGQEAGLRDRGEIGTVSHLIRDQGQARTGDRATRTEMERHWEDQDSRPGPMYE